jgi:predicted nucleic acid-binding protein
VSFLLDTCVLSDGVKSPADDLFLRWIRSTPEKEQFTSVIAVAELKFRIEVMPQGRRRNQLDDWFRETLRPSLGDRIIPFDESCAMVWASLRVRSPNAKFADSQIAATALAHGLTLVTRNVRDFAFAGLPVFNPWSK